MNRKLRKRLATNPEEMKDLKEGHTLDLVSNAVVIFTSEDEGHPIDNLVDGSRGRGNYQWIAGTSGPQVLIFNFAQHNISQESSTKLRKPMIPKPRRYSLKQQPMREQSTRNW